MEVPEQRVRPLRRPLLLPHRTLPLHLQRRLHLQHPLPPRPTIDRGQPELGWQPAAVSSRAAVPRSREIVEESSH